MSLDRFIDITLNAWRVPDEVNGGRRGLSAAERALVIAYLNSPGSGPHNSSFADWYNLTAQDHKPFSTDPNAQSVFFGNDSDSKANETLAKDYVIKVTAQGRLALTINDTDFATYISQDPTAQAAVSAIGDKLRLD